MYFDDQADAAVRRLWQRLADAGLPSLATRTHRQHRPHVSLAVAESLANADPAPLRSVLMSRRPALSLYTLTAEVTSAGIKDTATGAITLLTG